MRGRKGDDVLYGGAGGDDVLIGGRGRDQFFIDTQNGSFANIRDFKLGKDQLVFESPTMDRSWEQVGRDLLIRVDELPVARLLGVSSLSWDRDATFADFDGMS